MIPQKFKKSLPRLLGVIVLGAVIIAAAVLEYMGFAAVKYLAVAIVIGMAVELGLGVHHRIKREKTDVRREKLWTNYGLVIVPAVLILGLSAWFVGEHADMMLLLFIIIAAADTGGWFFGKWLGTTKMWEKLSPKKTWSGQIAGIISAVIAALLFKFIITGMFVPAVVFIAISVALLSQYGDLTASWAKRKMGLEDFGNVVPGHGGLMDRFDGWIYVLPLMALTML